jgi:hypothetical protein
VSETQLEAAGVKEQYAAQVAADLERNSAEQARIGAEAAALADQLRVLRRDHALLLSIQQALYDENGGGRTQQEGTSQRPEDDAAQVPQPRTAITEPAFPAPEIGTKPKPKTRARTKPAPKSTPKTEPRTKAETKPAPKSAPEPTAASKPAPKSQPEPTAAPKTGAEPKTTAASKAGAVAAEAPRKSGSDTRARKDGKAGASARKGGKAVEPSLVTLVREYVRAHPEPRSAAEITTALSQAHTDRTIKPTVVRTTAEGLVARGQVQRVKQGTSVFYTAPGSGPAAAAADHAPEA